MWSDLSARSVMSPQNNIEERSYITQQPHYASKQHCGIGQTLFAITFFPEVDMHMDCRKCSKSQVDQCFYINQYNGSKYPCADINVKNVTDKQLTKVDNT